MSSNNKKVMRRLLFASSVALLCLHVSGSGGIARAAENEAEQQEPVNPLLAAIKRLQLGSGAPSAVSSASQQGRQGDAEKTAAPSQKGNVAQEAAPSRLLTADEALETFYASPDQKPIWVDDQGLTTKALAVLREFRQADRYGLRPADFELSLPATAKLKAMEARQRNKVERLISKTVLKYARYAKGGRIDPRKLSHFQDRGPRRPDYLALLRQMQAQDDCVTTLRRQHPRHPQFEALRQKLLSISTHAHEMKPTSGSLKKNSFPSDGPVLRLGVKHKQVALLRKRLKLKAGDGSEADLFDDKLLSAVKAFQKSRGLGADGVVGAGTRAALGGRRSAKVSDEKLRALLLVNMERWRWMPEKLEGDSGVYVWANIPELRARIVKNGKVIFNEKAIAGQPAKQTPMFSDEMEWIEFNPTWFIPNSIKVADVLPSLKRKGRVMERYHLRVNCGVHGNNWRTIDWSKVDIRSCSVTQPSGVKSVLGHFKFKFPNKHSVYMHDTLTPALFNQTHRILSHGCVRVQHPQRMAEILLANDKGMSKQRIAGFLAHNGLHTERFRARVPVHMTYFSIWVRDDGGVSIYRDYYGHDKRLAQALLGEGRLFRGAVYGGSHRSRPRRPRIKPLPNVLPSYMQ